MLHVRFLLSTPASSVQSLQSEKRSREKTLRARRDRINPEGYQEQDASEAARCELSCQQKFCRTAVADEEGHAPKPGKPWGLKQLGTGLCSFWMSSCPNGTDSGRDPERHEEGKGRPRNGGGKGRKKPAGTSDERCEAAAPMFQWYWNLPASVKVGHLAGKTRQSCQLLLVQNGGSMGSCPDPFGAKMPARPASGEFCTRLFAEPTGHKSSCTWRPAVLFHALLSVSHRLDDDDDDGKNQNLHSRFWQVQSTVDQVEISARCRDSGHRVCSWN